MQFCPRFNQTLLAQGQSAVNQLKRVDAIDRDRVLIIRMKVGTMMRSAWLRVHANDDAEEASDFWQRCIPGLRIGKSAWQLLYTHRADRMPARSQAA